MKGIPYSADENQIKDSLSKFGTITNCELYRNDRGESLGRATITFENLGDAAQAIEGNIYLFIYYYFFFLTVN